MATNHIISIWLHKKIEKDDICVKYTIDHRTIVNARLIVELVCVPRQGSLRVFALDLKQLRAQAAANAHFD